MGIVKWILIMLIVVVVAVVVAGQAGMLQGTPPADLGVREGRLKAPSPTENSVTSQAALYPDAPQRIYAQVAPLPLRGDGPTTITKLSGIVASTPGARIVKATPDYLYAQYTSRVLGFVDDLELWYDPVAEVVQVRSASRLGRKDFGVNRARVEALRAALAATP